MTLFYGHNPYLTHTYTLRIKSRFRLSLILLSLSLPLLSQNPSLSRTHTAPYREVLRGSIIFVRSTTWCCANNTPRARSVAETPLSPSCPSLSYLLLSDTLEIPIRTGIFYTREPLVFFLLP
ncbi:hypothetical protein GGR58DRAFT_460442 [Xylaria digitata]|nr:hypothetical protein GGR58DRAFT_460442 [Xylaria digitata]